MRVCDLINHDTRQWDRGKLVATFTQRACAEILALPLNHLDSQDSLIWTENRAQKLSVKTAYRVALKLKSTGLAEHSSVQAHGITWGKIWKLNVPPKVWISIWRACSNCLPKRYSQRLSWNELLVCQQNIKHLCQPYAMLAYLYYCVCFNKTFYPSLKQKKNKKTRPQ